MFNPSYTFRPNLNPVAYHVFLIDESGMLCRTCAEQSSAQFFECEFPLYEDDIETARNYEPILCERCNKELAPPLEHAIDSHILPIEQSA